MEDLIYVSRIEYERLQSQRRRHDASGAFVYGVIVGILICVVTARIVGG